MSGTQEQRNARARAKGYKNEHEMLNARARDLGYENRTQRERLRASGKALGGDAAGAVDKSRRLVHQVGGQTVVNTTNHGKRLDVVEGRLSDASPTARVTGHVYWRGTDGKVHETHLWQHGASAAWVAARLDEDGLDFIMDDTESVLVGRYSTNVRPVEVVKFSVTIG